MKKFIIPFLILIFKIESAIYFKESFDNPDEFKIGYEEGVENVKIVKEKTYFKEGESSIRVEWSVSKLKDDKSPKVWIEKVYKEEIDMRGKRLKFYFMPFEGKWEGSDIIGGKYHGNFGIEFYDSNDKLVARHDWTTWWHVATNKIWGSLGEPLEFTFNVNPSASYRGGLTKGDGEPSKIKKIRFYSSGSSTTGKFSVIWDDLKEVSFDEYIFPGIKKFLYLIDENKIYDNWNLPEYKEFFLNKSSLNKKGNIFELYGGNLMLVFSSSGELHQMKDFVRGDILKFDKDIFSIFDGDKDFEEIKFLNKKTVYKKNILEILKENGEITFRNFIEPTKRAIFCKISIRNNSEKIKKLYIELNLPFSTEEESFFFDGCELLKLPYGNYERIIEGSYYGALYPPNLPFSIIYDDKSVFLLGRKPDDYISYEKILLKERKIIGYGMKIAIRPKEKNEYNFVFASISPSYRFFSGIDLYYKLFPYAFKPVENMDPNLYKGESMTSEYFKYRNLKGKDIEKIALELFRRFNIGWYWKFGGYKRIGDWFGEKEYFSNYKQEDGWKKRSEWEYFCDFEKFHKWRKEVWSGEDIKLGLSTGFYLCNFCEEELAKNLYNDEIISEGHPHLVYNYGPLGPNNYGPRIYWYYTKFGQDTLNSFKKIREEIPLSSICMDNIRGNGGFKFRGEKVLSKSEGISFDEKGIYIDESIGISQIFNQIHSLPPDKRGYKLAVAGDCVNTWYTAMNTDVLLIEDGSYGENQILNWFFNRIRFGRKPLCFHVTHWSDRLSGKIDIDKVSPEEIYEIYRKRFGFTQISGLCFGISFSIDDIMGVPDIFKVCRIPEEENIYGYQPLSGLRCNDKMIICSRFGNDLGSILSIGNTYSEKREFEFKIENKIIGDGTYLISDYSGKKINIDFTPEFTHFKTDINKYSAKVYKVIGKILNFNGKGKGEIEINEKDYGKRLKGDFEIENGKIPLKFEILIPENHKVESIFINGKGINFDVNNDILKFEIQDKKFEIVVDFKSKIFLSGKEKILNFKFFDETMNGCQIIIDDDCDFYDMRVAKRINSFFYLWASENKKIELDLPIKKNSEYKGGYAIFLKNSKNEGIELKDEKLFIFAPGSKEREKLVLELLKLLEEKYVFYGFMPYGRLREAGLYDVINLRRKAGLYENGILKFE
jgi:hypothetical protein